MTDTVDLVIVGAGFGGLCALHLARLRGLRAVVLERASGVGGTWFHNRYPGARVDVPSMEYSFSFDADLEQEWTWTERYASQPELRRYADHVTDRFGLRDDIVLDIAIAGAAFDEEGERWVVRSVDGRVWQARFLVMASGMLSTPNAPAIPGLGSFAGPVLHTAAWPEDAQSFEGLRVGVVGTGSSGLQVIPVLAREAAELTVFQRTALYAAPSCNGPLDPAEQARVKADYHGFRERNRAMRGGFGADVPPPAGSALDATPEEREAIFEDRWQRGGFALLSAFTDLLVSLEANEHAAAFVRRKIAAIVDDPETALLLQPRQPIGCKRLGVDSGGYYATFNRPNVHLVDVAADPLVGATETGLRLASGAEHPLDALVLATGFDAMTGTLTRLDLRGRGGVAIREAWAAGPRNLLGLMVSGFPNLFVLAGPGSTSAFTNVISAIEHHVGWILDCIGWLDDNDHATIEATPEAEAAWVERVNAAAERTLYVGCASWYLGANIPGKPRVFMPYAGGFPSYVRSCAQAAADGYAGFEVR